MKIICIGRNYADHAKEMNAPTPEFPLFFLKPDSAIHPKRTPFYYPEFTKDLNYECEVIVRINKLGKKVPDDIAVIGFTDGIISQFSTPTITTVSQNGIKMGQKAAKMLIERLEKDEDDEQYTTEIIETELIFRESTTT